MKRIVLVVALIAATEAKTQDAARVDSTKPPKSEKAITTKVDGKKHGQAVPAQHGVRPAPSPTPKLVPAEGKKKPRNDE